MQTTLPTSGRTRVRRIRATTTGTSFLPAPPNGAAPEALPGFAGIDLGGPRAVLVNGRFAPGLSSLAALPEGVRVDSLAAVLERQPEDPVALAKTLVSFSKTAPELTVKAAVVQGQSIGPDAVKSLAELPGKDELYAKLLMLLQAPATQLSAVHALPSLQLKHIAPPSPQRLSPPPPRQVAPSQQPVQQTSAAAGPRHVPGLPALPQPSPSINEAHSDTSNTLVSLTVMPSVVTSAVAE